MNSLSIILFSAVFLSLLVMENLLEIEQFKRPESALKSKNRYNFSMMIIFILIAGLRSPRTGADTYSYCFMYNKMVRNDVTLKYLFDKMVDAIKEGEFKDSLNWDVFSKMLSYVIKDAQLWMAVISAIFIIAVGIIIKRYSKAPMVSWAYFLGVFIFVFILQGLRQSVAMAIILFSLKFIYDRKFIKFLILVLLATLFHQSAIIFIIAYPLYNLKVTKIHFLIIGISFFACTVMPSRVKQFIGFFVEDSRFEDYLEGRENMYSVSGFLVLLMIFAFCYMFKDEEIMKEPQNQFLYTLSMLGLVFQSAAGLVAEMFRISYYFNMFNMLLIANVSTAVFDKKKMAIKSALILAFAAYFFISGGFNYKFFG